MGRSAPLINIHHSLLPFNLTPFLNKNQGLFHYIDEQFKLHDRRVKFWKMVASCSSSSWSTRINQGSAKQTMDISIDILGP